MGDPGTYGGPRSTTPPDVHPRGSRILRVCRARRAPSEVTDHAAGFAHADERSLAGPRGGLVLRRRSPAPSVLSMPMSIAAPGSTSQQTEPPTRALGSDNP